MAGEFNKYPYTNFHELNLEYFIKKFDEIFTAWSELYNTMLDWKSDTTTELADWKTSVEDDLDARETALRAELEAWKDATEADISDWEVATLAALDDWKDAAEAAFEVIRVQAAASATEATNAATAAGNAKTAAETAQAAAEAAAASVVASASQIANNKDHITRIETDLHFAKNLADGATWTNGKGVNYSTGANIGAQEHLKASDLIPLNGATKIVYTRMVTIASSAPSNGIAFFDSNQTVISGGGIRSGYGAQSATYEMYNADVPSGAEYVRCSAWIDTLNVGQFQLFNAADYYAQDSKYIETTKEVFNVTDLIGELRINATVFNGVVNSSGKKSGSGTSFELSNNSWKLLTITGGSYYTYVTFATASVAALSTNTNIPLCEGTSARYVINSAQTLNFDVPDDCTHIVFMRSYEQNTFTPAAGALYSGGYGLLQYVTDSIAKAPVGLSKSTVTACIIGASLERGIIHNDWEHPDRATNNAETQAKAYLKVALENNGIVVRNLSEGGMGFIRESTENHSTGKSICAATDFTLYQSVYICLGYNDYNHDEELGTPEDAITADTVCGGLKYCIETIYASNPKIKIFVKHMGGKQGNNEATVPYNQAQLEAAMKQVCDNYGVEMITLGYIAGSYNKDLIYPDGTHPTAEVEALMAIDTTGRITFK